MTEKSSQHPSNFLTSKQLHKRRKAEQRFKAYGISTIIIVISVLLLLLTGIIFKGYSAFTKTEIALEIFYDPKVFKESIPKAILKMRDTGSLIRRALQKEFPDIKDSDEIRKALQLISPNARISLIRKVVEDPRLIGTTRLTWVSASDNINLFIKKPQQRKLPAYQRQLDDQKIAWIDQLRERKKLRQRFNVQFFTNGDSREPEQAGILGALMGSFYTMLVTLLLAFPIGIGAAIYLQEFAGKSRLISLLELNISNLAAVPSIIFGLLGLAVFLNFMDFPRSSALVGGMTLSLMTMPIIILAARAAIQAVPSSIREAAEGLGASRVQLVFHHIVPLAMPGILTGTILGMARALGESAPLLMIGMVAFVVDIPHTPLDPTTVLPVQIFSWLRNPEQGFIENTAAAIMVLLLFLILMNLAAIVFRKRFDHKW
ncbi:MAG: phosphate ABC transporter permease PstA [Alphaproteobacteria bacterium]|nr:phosphate ABC transporter permease PstA [Alphaproteobacteria bacterium]